MKNEKDERDLYKVGEISSQFLTEQASFLQRANGSALFLTLFCSCVKAHLRSTELENTKLSAELQMLKAVELNREVTIAQFQEELERLRACVAQRDSLEKELLANKAEKVVKTA